MKCVTQQNINEKSICTFILLLIVLSSVIFTNMLLFKPFKTTPKGPKMNHNVIPSRTEDITTLTEDKNWGCGSVEDWVRYFNNLWLKHGTQKANATHISDLSEDMLYNIEKILSYPIEIDHKYIRAVSLDGLGMKRMKHKCNESESQIPVFVTAVSSEYFYVSQALIENIEQNVRPHFKQLKIIYYDIGLTKKERDIVRRYCKLHDKCEFRRFPFNRFPPHVKILKGYAWKPIILQLVAKEYDFIFWMDTSIRLTGQRLGELFSRARRFGMQIIPLERNVARVTGAQTFKALEENPADFLAYPGIGATSFVLSRNGFTFYTILKPWVLCALSYGCMVYDNSEKDLVTSCDSDKTMHSCHRFDQSVLGIILARLFTSHVDVVKMNFNPLESVIAIKRSVGSKYIETKLRKTGLA